MGNKHCYKTARLCESPNFNERPEGEAPSLVVIHNISLPPGQYGGPYIDQLFTNCLPSKDHPFFEEIAQLQVSSHLLIRRDGEVVQYVPFDKKAWHAGESSFEDRQECNDFSIGIELEGSDDEAFTNSQYEALLNVTHDLIRQYPKITKDRIVGHSDIAPGRKTDPGPYFNWSKYLDGIN